jgi:hypothetical protein
MNLEAGNQNIQLIAHTLKRIQEEGGDSNFVIFIADSTANYYVQAAGQNGDPNLYLEAVHNDYIDVNYKLDAGALTKLEALGWVDPAPDNGNFYKDWQANSDEARLKIAQDVVRTFIEVYGFDSDQELDVNLNLE